jgi:DHA2 family multidrug resistance protein-like MFS transporter
VADAVSGAAGEALLSAARLAFVDAMQVAAMAGAAVVIVAAVVAGRLLRGAQQR